MTTMSELAVSLYSFVPVMLGVVAFNGCGLCQIQRLALRNPGNDIHQDNVSELFVHYALGCSCTNVARANNRYLSSCHSLSLKLRL